MTIVATGGSVVSTRFVLWEHRTITAFINPNRSSFSPLPRPPTVTPRVVGVLRTPMRSTVVMGSGDMEAVEDGPGLDEGEDVDAGSDTTELADMTDSNEESYAQIHPGWRIGLRSRTVTQVLSQSPMQTPPTSMLRLMKTRSPPVTTTMLQFLAQMRSR